MKRIKRIFNDITLLFLFTIAFIIAHIYAPLDRLNALSDNFNKVAIGIAALITAYYGSSYFREELFRRRSTSNYRGIYPPDKHGQSFIIIASKKDEGGKFLLDLKTQKKHHIWNMKTMYDLGWQTFPVKILPDSIFQTYSTGEAIRTRGDLGE